jgi:hypothetical protein
MSLVRTTALLAAVQGLYGTGGRLAESSLGMISLSQGCRTKEGAEFTVEKKQVICKGNTEGGGNDGGLSYRREDHQHGAEQCQPLNPHR